MTDWIMPPLGVGALKLCRPNSCAGNPRAATFLLKRSLKQVSLIRPASLSLSPFFVLCNGLKMYL